MSQVSWVSPLHSSLWKEERTGNISIHHHPTNQIIAFFLVTMLVFCSVLFLNVLDHGNPCGRERFKPPGTFFNHNFPWACTKKSVYLCFRQYKQWTGSGKLPDGRENGSTHSTPFSSPDAANINKCTLKEKCADNVMKSVVLAHKQLTSIHDIN